ncbi:MAG TPA: alpha/beta hydrolase [Thermoanaerobaculia bacterium]
MDTDLRHRTIATNGVNLHVVEAGPEDGRLVILLHGFPEFWYGWRKQIGPLAAAGFRVLVPDQRGYNLSDKPKGVRPYNLDDLALDVIGLIGGAGREKACVVAHDWGGAVGWWLGMKFPDRVERLALLNMPHLSVMRRAILKNPAQRRRVSYMFFFQLPWLPERALSKENWKYLAKALQATSRPGTFSEEDLAHYREAWSRPGAITGMLNWYRAGLRTRPRPPKSSRVSVPTLLIWGPKDRALLRELAQPSIDRCDDGRLVFLEEATHWVQHEEPEEVNRLLIDFLSR